MRVKKLRSYEFGACVGAGENGRIRNSRPPTRAMRPNQPPLPLTAVAVAIPGPAAVLASCILHPASCIRADGRAARLPQETRQRVLLVRPSQLVESPAFDLPHSFAGKTHPLTDFPQGLRLVVDQTEAKLENASLPLRQLCQRIAKGPGKALPEEKFVSVG